jgi:hypothetical protein
MREAMLALQAEAGVLFATTIIFVVFFLIARVGGVRQPIALAFALMPLLIAVAAQGLAGAATTGLL